MATLSTEIPRRLNDPPRMFWWDLDVALLVLGCAIGGMTGRLAVGVITDLANWRWAMGAIGVAGLAAAIEPLDLPWRSAPAALAAQLGERLWLAPSCSLLHVPVDLAQESELDPEVKPWLAFAVQKLNELKLLAKGLNQGRESIANELAACRHAIDSRRHSPRVVNPPVRQRLAAIQPGDDQRHSAYPQRAQAQQAWLRLPLLPTTPFVLLAAFCFSRGSDRVEAWLLAHPRFGAMVADWRARRAIPMRAKQLAWVMMALGSSWSWWVMPSPWRWLPPLICLIVATWMWRLPTAEPR